MKNIFNFIAITLIALVLGSCHKNEPISPYTLEDLEGLWVWTYIDGDFNSNIWFDQITANGNDTCHFIEGDKWAEKVFSISVKNGVISLSEHEDEFLIINVDYSTLVVENLTTNVRMTAEKARVKDNPLLVGTWHCDAYKVMNNTFNNYNITYKDDMTYTYSYDGALAITGNYFLFNDFVVYQSNQAGIAHIEMSLGKTSPQITEVVLNSDGSANVNLFQRVRGGAQITLEDINKTWLTTTKDGETIPLSEAAICKVIDNNGHSIIAYIKNGTWTEDNVTLTLENNIITRVIGSTTEQFDVIYFDRETIIWQNLSTGSVVTRKAIREPDKNKEKILGFWKEEADGGKVIFTADSVFFKKGESEMNGKYKLYGDIVVTYTETECKISVIELGYDKERAERYAKWITKQGELLVTETFYKPNLEAQLAGGWIWMSEDGEEVPTNCYELSFYNPITGMHDYQTFGEDKEHILEPYYIEGRVIYYPEDTEDLPNETIMSLNDSVLVTNGSDGITYGASRITMDNPLKEDIIGTWTCSNFITTDTSAFTHTFEKNDLVVCVNNETTIIGTYKLYNNLLVMHFVRGSEDISVLWLIKDVYNGSMTFHQLLDDGTTINNILTKQ